MTNVRAMYRKKPVVIQACKLDAENSEDIVRWVNGRGTNLSRDASVFGNAIGTEVRGVYIPTEEGVMEASLGDFVIEGVQGEFYPCKPDIFEATYEYVGIP